MPEPDLPGVKSQVRFLGRFSAMGPIERVPRQWTAQGLEVDTDLVGASGSRAAEEEALALSFHDGFVVGS